MKKIKKYLVLTLIGLFCASHALAVESAKAGGKKTAAHSKKTTPKGARRPAAKTVKQAARKPAARKAGKANKPAVQKKKPAKKTPSPVNVKKEAVSPAVTLPRKPEELAVVPQQKFTVKHYVAQGNTLLPAAEVERILKPFTGVDKNFGDIQQALETLENAYRKKGYSTVQVYLPEQELTQGTVVLKVTEAAIGKVEVSGNRYFDTPNIRASLPALKEGTIPNTRAMSESVQLANENPAKQVEVLLSIGDEEGKIDAKVNVTDEKPLKFYATLDNSGTLETGRHRLGVAMQHSNLFNQDHTLSLAYTTSPDKPSGVDVDIYSLGYRVPLYSIGDSLDFIYGTSTISTPSSTSALGSALGIVGKGDIYGLRWNHYFMRQGEYSHKLILGADLRAMKSTCTSASGTRLVGVAGCEDYTTRPVSATYTGQWVHPGEMADFSLSIARNIVGGSGGSEASYILAASGRPAKPDFTILRLSGSYVRALPQDWQARFALSGQYADTALTPAEQIGLAGSTTVRGFSERAAAADEGWVGNLELYTPELAPLIGLPAGNLRLLAFYDWSWGTNHPIPGVTATNAVMSSVGVGLRYSLKKDMALRIDYARLQDHFPITPLVEPVDKWNGHANLIVGF